MKKKHPEHVNHERWLVSYADFITLLFAFFVVLFASGQSDKRKQVKLAEAIHSAFAQMGIFETRSKIPALTESSGASGTSNPSPVETPMPTHEEEETAKAALLQEKQVKEKLEKKAGQNKVSADAVKLHTTAEGLVISLREAGFFDSGSAQVRVDAMDELIEVAHAMPDGAVRVEGHTDNVPIHTAQFPSNWELSSARAAAIARILLEYGKVNPSEMAAEGLAEFRPIADNDSEAGRSQNRRVDVVVMRRPKVPVAAASVAAPKDASAGSAAAVVPEKAVAEGKKPSAGVEEKKAAGKPVAKPSIAPDLKAEFMASPASRP